MAIGRRFHTQQVHYLRKNITYSDVASVTLGTLPVGALVIGAGAVVTTAFNSGTSNVIDIGTSGDADGFATAMDLQTVGNIVWDAFATSNDLYNGSAEVTVTCLHTPVGTAATTGSAEVYVTYLADNDG